MVYNCLPCVIFTICFILQRRGNISGRNLHRNHIVFKLAMFLEFDSFVTFIGRCREEIINDKCGNIHLKLSRKNTNVALNVICFILMLGVDSFLYQYYLIY